MATDRPAFYALAPGGWRDLATLLHPPYTVWHLSYVALGAAAAPQIYADRLVAALAAFFLAVGVSAHALDELAGRPLRTRLSDRSLIALAAVGLAGALAIGVAGIITVSATLIPFVVGGGFAVLAYNLELFGGRFHTDFWFAATWGAFPALTGWWSNALSVGSVADALAAAGVVLGCFGLTVAQRRLSTPVRELRRRDGVGERANSGSATAPSASSARPPSLPPWTRRCGRSRSPCPCSPSGSSPYASSPPRRGRPRGQVGFNDPASRRGSPGRPPAPRASRRPGIEPGSRRPTPVAREAS